MRGFSSRKPKGALAVQARNKEAAWLVLASLCIVEGDDTPGATHSRLARLTHPLPTLAPHPDTDTLADSRGWEDALEQGGQELPAPFVLLTQSQVSKRP